MSNKPEPTVVADVPKRPVSMKRMSEADQIAELKAKVADLEAERDARELRRNPNPREVVPGTVTYRLTKQHYRKGTLYEPGDLITVTDEVPGRSWLRVDQAAVEAAVEAKSASLFAAGRGTPAAPVAPDEV